MDLTPRLDESATTSPHSDRGEIEGGVDSGDVTYNRKAHLLNESIQQIGMGRYQWHLSVVAGFGYFSNIVWIMVPGLILLSFVNEFHFKGPMLIVGAQLGLFVGGVFWGLTTDTWGRKIPFNTTLAISGIFSVTAGFSSNHIYLSSFLAIVTLGTGGNVVVDTTIFLEFLPASHQYILAATAVSTPIGQLVGALVAWSLMGKFSCQTPTGMVSSCTPSENKGWRYFLFTMGGLILVLWAIRFFGFPVYESPKYLLGRGRGKEAVEVVHKVAKFNGKKLKLTAEDLRALEYGGMKAGTTPGRCRRWNVHVKPLFANPALARSTVMLIVIWGLMGLASILYLSFVPYYLSTRGLIFGDGSVYLTYRNLVIISVVCLPGPSFSAYMIECRPLGRRRTVAISAGLAGIFVLATITARSSTALLLWNCACSITAHMVYPALQTMTPELFPTRNRATGMAVVATAHCISGVMAPVIALYANLATPVPIYIAGAIYLVAAVIALLLPYESRGRASM